MGGSTFHIALDNGATIKVCAPSDGTVRDLLAEAQKTLLVGSSPHHQLRVNDSDEPLDLDQAVSEIDPHHPLLLVCAPGAPLLSVMSITRSPDSLADLLANASEADLTTPDSDGCTPLHYAVGNPAILATLLEKIPIPDLELRDTNGRTPIMRAAGIGCLESIELLREAGANISQTDLEGKNIMHYFCMGVTIEEETEPKFSVLRG